MHRARLLVLKAHPDLAHAPRKRILISSFLLGLYDRQLASSLAVVKIQTAANAEGLAANGEAVRRDQQSRRSTNNLPEEASALDPEGLEEPSDAEPLHDEKEELMAALGTLNPTRKNFNLITNPPESDARQARGATVAASMATLSLIALDRIAKGPNVLLLGPSSNVYSAKAITSYVTARRYLQINKQQNAQDKPKKRSPRSKLQRPWLATRCPMSSVLPSSATEQLC